MSHHLFRRVFATTVLLFNNIPMEIASEFLEHTKISRTKDSYATIVNKKIAAKMAVFLREVKLV